MLFLGKI